jgi:hypothetical protein
MGTRVNGEVGFMKGEVSSKKRSVPRGRNASPVLGKGARPDALSGGTHEAT